MFLVALSGAYASEDDTVIAQLRQRAQAQALSQQANNLAARWDWLRRRVGLERPPPNQDYQVVFHRPDRQPPLVPRNLVTVVSHNLDPINIVVGVENRWPDLGPYAAIGISWSVIEGHRSVYSSDYFSDDHRHVMLITTNENVQHPLEFRVFLEIHWHSFAGLDRGMSIPWIKARISYFELLQFAGVLRSCTSTHRCHVQVDGDMVDAQNVVLYKGDHIFIEGGPVDPPSDTESETHVPSPINACRSGHSASSDTSDPASDMSMADDDLVQLATNDDTMTLAIYRSGGVMGQASSLILPLSGRNREVTMPVLGMWPDLRYVEWGLRAVSETYNRDFQPDGVVKNTVLVTLADLPGPVYQVLMLVVSIMNRLLIKAHAFMPFVDRQGILGMLGLATFCAQDGPPCRVYLNGLQLHGLGRHSVTSGDYIRVVLPRRLDDETEADLAGLFNTLPDDPGWGSLEPATLAIIAQDMPCPHGRWNIHGSNLYRST